MTRAVFVLAALAACGGGSKKPGPTAVPVKHDEHQTDEELEAACARKHAESCIDLGARYAQGDGVDVDHARAAKLFDQACTLGDQDGCAWFGRGVPKNPQRGIELFRKSCDQGTNEATATGCYYLAVSFATGEGVAQNHAEAAKYYGLACARSWGEGCAALAEQYVAGQGVKADKTKAAELNHRACELNFAPACVKDRKAP